MGLYERIIGKEEKVALVGLGYVGMPIAVAFAKKIDLFPLFLLPVFPFLATCLSQELSLHFWVLHHLML